ncbi:MAG: histidinol-phosphate transaminase [Clostridiales bacterium]|nr:histidinol-phosphate transaminase [Clostridiales bacterium]
MNYLRDDLKDLIPYKAGSTDYKIRLNSNENPFDLPKETKNRIISKLSKEVLFNRYPDPDATLLREGIANQLCVGKDNILVGSGSDELIQMIINAFVDSDEAVLCPNPSFSMYNIYTKIGGRVPIEVPLDESFRYDFDAFLSLGKAHNAKLAFVCNPNNPTGTTVDVDALRAFVEDFEGIVVIDEAYIEFSEGTAIDFVLGLENAIVLRTFSKAFGIAGLRVGYITANEDLVKGVGIVKSPYNLNAFSQFAARELLRDIDIVKERIAYIISERDRLYDKLCRVDSIKVYPPYANFLFIKVKEPRNIYENLLKKDVLIRSFIGDSVLNNYIRVTIGSREENDTFLREFLKIVEGAAYNEEK